MVVSLRPPQTSNGGQLQPATPASFETLQQRIKTVYGDKCQLPPMPESIPNNNHSYNLQGFSREDVLDITIQQLIDQDVLDPTEATTYVTGMYGIESKYGDPGQDNWANTYVGPFQCGDAFIQNYCPGGGNKKNIIDQIIAISNHATKVWLNLNEAFADRRNLLDVSWIYICHQQGGDGNTGGGAKLLRAYFDTPKMLASQVNGLAPILTQAGRALYNDATHYNPLTATVKQFVDCEINIFNQSASRSGGGNCGEFAVEFLAGTQ